MGRKKKRKTKRKIKANQPKERAPKWRLPELCQHCVNTCSFRVKKGGDLIECPKYRRTKNETAVLIAVD